MDETQEPVTISKNTEDWDGMTHEELEFQYSPSRHSPYQPPDTIITTYLNKVKKDIAASRAEVPWKSYALDPSCDSSLVMDVYGEDLPEEAPLLVFVHGGYWQELSKDLVGGLMAPLHRAGVMTAVLPYTLAPKASIIQMVREVEKGLLKCVQLVRRRGARTIVVAGWSAGAQLVTQALSARVAQVQTESLNPSSEPPQSDARIHCPAVDSDPPSCIWQQLKGVVGISGIYDLRPLVTTYINEPLKLSRGEAWLMSPAHPSSCRALLSALPPSTPFLMAVAEHDSPQFRRQGEHYAECLRTAGLKNVEELLVTSSDHFRIISDLADHDNPFMKRLLQFIKECN